MKMCHLQSKGKKKNAVNPTLVCSLNAWQQGMSDSENAVLINCI